MTKTLIKKEDLVWFKTGHSHCSTLCVVLVHKLKVLVLRSKMLFSFKRKTLLLFRREALFLLRNEAVFVFKHNTLFLLKNNMMFVGTARWLCHGIAMTLPMAL